MRPLSRYAGDAFGVRRYETPYGCASGVYSATQSVDVGFDGDDPSFFKVRDDHERPKWMEACDTEYDNLQSGYVFST
jgi:hypothetical protein